MPKQVCPVGELRSIKKLGTPGVAKSSEAALLSVETCALATCAGTCADNVGAATRTSRNPTSGIPVKKLLGSGGLALTLLLLLLALTTTAATAPSSPTAAAAPCTAHSASAVPTTTSTTSTPTTTPTTSTSPAACTTTTSTATPTAPVTPTPPAAATLPSRSGSSSDLLSTKVV
ncbi:unnamed protein product, partial [Closterium sp. NIES-54]